jgi:hypothetical protein
MGSLMVLAVPRFGLPYADAFTRFEIFGVRRRFLEISDAGAESLAGTGRIDPDKMRLGRRYEAWN